MAKYDVYVPYAGVALIEVEAASKTDAISKAQNEDYIASDIIPDEAAKLWGDAWSETEAPTPELRERCPDCSVVIGENHLPGCDIERCPCCGLQRLSCDCSDADRAGLPRIPWNGEFPGTSECREYGLYAKLIPGLGWVQCGKDEEDAQEDLNRLYEFGTWDTARQRWVLS